MQFTSIDRPIVCGYIILFSFNHRINNTVNISTDCSLVSILLLFASFRLVIDLQCIYVCMLSFLSKFLIFIIIFQFETTFFDLF